jgi:hypothetical protein
MDVLHQKKLLVARILPHLVGAPANAVQELLQQSVEDLARILEDVSRKHAQLQAREDTDAHIQEMIRISKADHAWAYALAKVSLNGKYLVDAEANHQILEGMLQPHEEPSPAIYETLLKQYASNFSWEVPRPVRTDADRQAEFARICREHLLSECEANKQLHKDGVSLDAWAGASGIERAQYASEAAQARQHFLIHNATPTQLKQEAAYESQTNREAAQREEADRSQRVVLSRQGHYPALPSTNANGEVIDAAYLRKISTINFPLFRALVKKHGSGNLTARLRNEN